MKKTGSVIVHQRVRHGTRRYFGTLKDHLPFTHPTTVANIINRYARYWDSEAPLKVAGFSRAARARESSLQILISRIPRPQTTRLCDSKRRHDVTDALQHITIAIDSHLLLNIDKVAALCG